MVFEAHCMSFPCTELLLFNYAKVNTVFHSMAPLMVQYPKNTFCASIKCFVPYCLHYFFVKKTAFA